jgi:hypothetical protein
MTLLKLPPRRAAAIFVVETSAGGWLVIAREHGWLHGDAVSAFQDAEWLSQNFNLPVRVTP